MTRILAPKTNLFAVAVLILQFFTFAAGQDVEFRIQIKPATAEITGTFSKDRPPSMWFLDEYGDEKRIVADRLSEIELAFVGKDGPIRQRKRLTGNESIQTANLLTMAYQVELRPRQSPFAAAHISWVNEESGLLMLDDLLPQINGRAAKISFEIPPGWKIVTAETELSPGVYSVPRLEKAAFYLGKNLRLNKTKAATLAISGDTWFFKDAEATEMIDAIMGEYAGAFGPLKSGAAVVRISEFPVNQMMGAWEADTRGRSVTIVSADMPFRNLSLQRLHEQLRHELFHLWLPNGVNLTGRYDWFYEGFALYQSLKTGVGLNQIRFDDYLNTLSGARSIDRAGDRRASLLALSSERWSGGNTKLYARGMLAAFACDLAMLRASNGKRSVTDLLAAIIRKHSPPAAAVDAETAILAEMRSRPEVLPVVNQLITGNERFDLADLLSAAGLEVVKAGSSETIKIVAKPTGKQKDLLKRLGSENWRNVR